MWNIKQQTSKYSGIELPASFASNFSPSTNKYFHTYQHLFNLRGRRDSKFHGMTLTKRWGLLYCCSKPDSGQNRPLSFHPLLNKPSMLFLIICWVNKLTKMTTFILSPQDESEIPSFLNVDAFFSITRSHIVWWACYYATIHYNHTLIWIK